MRRMMMKKTLSLLLSAVFALSAFAVLFGASFADDGRLLHTEGENIVNGKGETVVLRGTNFGGWGIMEDWFTPFTDAAGEDNMYEALVSRFGVEKTHALSGTGISSPTTTARGTVRRTARSTGRSWTRCCACVKSTGCI